MRKLITCLPLLFGLGVVLSAQDRVAISGFVAAGMASPADGLSTAPSSDQLEIDM